MAIAVKFRAEWENPHSKGVRQMNSDCRLSANDIIKVLEAHGVLPESTLLDEIQGLLSLYDDILRKRLGDIPVSFNRKKALLALLEEGLMQEGFIPNNQPKQFEIPEIEELLKKVRLKS